MRCAYFFKAAILSSSDLIFSSASAFFLRSIGDPLHFLWLPEPLPLGRTGRGFRRCICLGYKCSIICGVTHMRIFKNNMYSHGYYTGYPRYCQGRIWRNYRKPVPANLYPSSGRVITWSWMAPSRPRMLAATRLPLGTGRGTPVMDSAWALSRWISTTGSPAA